MEKSPDAFRTISEVAEILETPAHVLRFWESRFPQIRPVKRAGGRRYYRPADVALLTGIKRLLHDEGMTIRGVQKILREQGVRYVSGMTDDTSTEDDDAALEAALIASTGGDAAAQPLPPAEAESAQIIALESALGDRGTSTEPAEAASDQDDMPAIARFLVSATSLSEVGPEESDDKASADDGISDLVTRMVASAASDDSTKAMQSPDMEELAEETEAPAMTDEAEDEAPMAVWAEEETQETPEPVVPTLRVTRIGAAKAVAQPALPGFRPEAEPSAAEAPAAQPPDTEPAPALPEPETGPTLAARLRRTRAADLAASDRNTISVIRARARSLRDRLTSPIRSGH